MDYINSIDLKHYAYFLGITAIFIIIVLRACYFCFIAKSDPVNTVTKLPPNKLAQYFKKKKDREIRQVTS